MKIILKDFNYKGHPIKSYECDVPQITNLEDVPKDKIVDYILENLDELSKIES